MYRVADLPSLESEQEQRRQELTAYLQHLKQNPPDKKQAGTAFGAEFYSLVQRLSQERKTTYESIRGLHCWHMEHFFLVHGMLILQPRICVSEGPGRQGNKD